MRNANTRICKDCSSNTANNHWRLLSLLKDDSDDEDSISYACSNFNITGSANKLERARKRGAERTGRLKGSEVVAVKSGVYNGDSSDTNCSGPAPPASSSSSSSSSSSKKSPKNKRRREEHEDGKYSAMQRNAAQCSAGACHSNC